MSYYLILFGYNVSTWGLALAVDGTVATWLAKPRCPIDSVLEAIREAMTSVVFD